MRNKIKLFLVIMLFLSFFVFNRTVFAEGEWGTGGGPGAGCTTDCGTADTDSNGYYNCYSIDRCPRWILVTQDTYRAIIKEKRWHPQNAYSLPECLNDEYVVIAGNQRKNGSIQIKNFVPEEGAVRPYKSRYIYTSEATSVTSVSNKTIGNWNISDYDRMKQTFMNRKVTGEDYTYYDLLQTVVTLSGEKEENIVAFCKSMVTPDPTYFSSSKVSINGTVIADTGIVKEQTTRSSSDKYTRTDETTIAFTHDIYADMEEEGVSWSVGKSFKKGGTAITLTGGTGGTTSGTANITTAFTGHDDATFISTTSPQYSDTYVKNLTLASTYELCESMAVDDTSSFLSKACANLKVPYNFSNTATISLGNVNIFAGEKANISTDGKVKVNKRKNDTTGGTYATRVDDAKLKVVSYLSSSNESDASAKEVTSDDICSGLEKTDCNTIITKTGKTLNADNNSNGEEMELSALLGSSSSVNIYDAPAGTYYCVALAVYPASSGNDTMMDKTGSNTWYISKPSCKKIAKKPSIQVWGSGMYTAGKVAVSNATKFVVKDVMNDYAATGNENVIFGSWVEHNILANGLVNLASGAADGLAGGVQNRTQGGLNGSYSSSAGDQTCIISPLTMPNSKCNTGSGNIPGGSSGSISAPVDKDALIARFTEDDGSGNYTVHSSCALTHVPSFDTYKTHVYDCNGNFNINGDLEIYSGSYTSLFDVPKLIIYTNKNINIKCDVTRIDAVLIADGEVDTCSDSNSINDSKRAKQLRINGTVIANKLKAKRTYGAATGTNSGEPAEIINFDTSLYLWGAPQAEATGSGKLELIYQTELAPRY